MTEPRVVVHGDLSMLGADRFLDRRPELPVRETSDVAAALVETGRPVALVVAPFTWDDDYLDALEPRDWVCTVGVGYDEYPVDAFERRGLTFTNVPGVSAPQVAEHVFAMATAFNRNLWAFRDQQRRGQWTVPSGPFVDLAGGKCCVLGLGHIGEAVAERARAFGMDAHGVKRDPADHNGNADTVVAPRNLPEAVADATLLVVTVPLTDSTEGMVGRPELDALADDAVVVNVSRGPVLDQSALLTALERGDVRAAGLDVTDPEPLPEDSPLWDRSDVIVTAHSAWRSEAYAERFLDRFLPEFDRWRRGDDLRHRVV